MNTADTILYWILNSVRGKDLPIKTEVDGEEFLIILNPATQRVEMIKNNNTNTSLDWAQYTGDFTDNSGVLKLGKLDDSLTVKVNSVDNKIELKGLTEADLMEINQTLKVSGLSELNGGIALKTNTGDYELCVNPSNGDFEITIPDGLSRLAAFKLNYNGVVTERIEVEKAIVKGDGSVGVTIDYEGDAAYTQVLQEKDGFIALLSDIPENTLPVGFYEEGDYNPDLPSGYTYTSSEGSYVRAGNQVTYNFDIKGIDGSALQLDISKPFVSDGLFAGELYFLLNSSLSKAEKQIVRLMSIFSGGLIIGQLDSDSALNNISFTNGRITGSITYKTSVYTN